jgi:transaldolase
VKFFLDTADLGEIEEAASWGVLAGVTTNPTLYQRVGGKLAGFHGHLKRPWASLATRSSVKARSWQRSRRTSS